MAAEVLRLENVRKSFGSVNALKDASLSLHAGEVVALLGDNGAGKSTLIKGISGVYAFDRGEVYVRNQRVSIRSAREAMELGIETIHQDTSLAPDLSIARNLFLGREPVRLDFLGVFAPMDFGKLRSSASQLLKRVGISKALDADASVNTLSGGERQSIAISRAMQFAAQVIILDEPTNNLGVEETHGVLRFIKEVRDGGHAVLLVTHNIHHVFEVADRIIVMRRGEITAELDVADTDLLTVESRITGIDVATLLKDTRAHSGARRPNG
jgi:simple sugar transport system ATP-binding protein